MSAASTNLTLYIQKNKIDIPSHILDDTPVNILTYAVQHLDENVCLNILKHIDKNNLDSITCIDDHDMVKILMLTDNVIDSLDISDDRFYSVLDFYEFEEYCHMANLTLPMLAIKRGFCELAYQLLVQFPRLRCYMNTRNAYTMSLERGYTNITKLFSPPLIRLLSCNKYSKDFSGRLNYQIAYILYCLYEKTGTEICGDRFSKIIEELGIGFTELSKLPETEELYSDQLYLHYQDGETATNFMTDYHMKFQSEFIEQFVDISDNSLCINYIPKLLLELIPELNEHGKIHIDLTHLFLGERMKVLSREYSKNV